MLLMMLLRLVLDLDSVVQAMLMTSHLMKDKDVIAGDEIVDKNTRYGISIRPGIKYTLTDQFAIVATLGGLYFDHTKEPDPSVDHKSTIGLIIDTGLDFGLVYSF